MDKFADLPCEDRMANGIRYIPTYTNAVLSCEVIDVKDLETQLLTIANVVEAKVLSKAPSCSGEFFCGRSGAGMAAPYEQRAGGRVLPHHPPVCALEGASPLGEAQAVDKT